MQVLMVIDPDALVTKVEAGVACITKECGLQLAPLQLLLTNSTTWSYVM